MGNCLPSLAHGRKRRKVLKHHAMKKPTPTSIDLLKKDNIYAKDLAHEIKEPVIRVKILLTKKEAAQLIANCYESEKMMTDRVLHELDKFKSFDRNSTTLQPCRSSWRPLLESIPECS